MATGDIPPWQTVRVEKDGVTYEGRYRIAARHITVEYDGRVIAGSLVGMPPYAQACLMLKHLIDSGSRAR